MSDAPALYQRNTDLARLIAGDFRLPGHDRDDVHQEARIALWEAARCYDKTRGPFRPFARLVITRRLTDLVRAATCQARRAHTVPLHEGIPARDDTPWLRDAAAALTPLERAAVAAKVNGTYDFRDRRMENALCRARAKLRRAA